MNRELRQEEQKAVIAQRGDAFNGIVLKCFMQPSCIQRESKIKICERECIDYWNTPEVDLVRNLVLLNC